MKPFRIFLFALLFFSSFIANLAAAGSISSQDVRDYLLDDQNRIVLKKHSLEIAPFVGPFLGEALRNSIFYGGRTTFYITERFGLAIDGGFSQAGIEPFTLGTVTTEGDRNSYFTNVNLTYAIPAALLPRKRRVLPVELFMTAGGGYFKRGNFFEPSGNIGGGTRIFANPYLTLRIDIRNYLIWIHDVSGPHLSANAVIMFGLSFFIPTRTPNLLETQRAATENPTIF